MGKRLIALLGLALAVVAAAHEPSLADLGSQPQLWPTVVTIKKATKATVLRDGKPAGMMLLGSGQQLAVVGVSGDGVTVRAGAAAALVPADNTDFFSQFGKLHPEYATASQKEAVPAAAPPPAAAAAPAWAGPATVMQRRLAGRIVRLDGDALRPADAAQLGGVKLYGLYYSASWCGPCRQFTPRFVDAYRELKEKYPQFEVVFVSIDHSAGDMADYMRSDRMPWLALSYDEAQRASELRRYCGPGIPCLVLVDAQGRVLSDSFEGDDYVGPGKVLEDARRLLAQSR